MRLLLVLAVLMLAEPNTPLQAQTYAPEGVRITKLVDSELLVRDDLHGLPMDMEIVGDRIVVVDQMADRAVVVFDLQGNLIARHLPKGDGPKEARRVNTVSGSGDTVYAWDAGRSRVVKFPVDESPQGEPYTADILPGFRSRSLVPIEDGYLLAEGIDGLFVRWRGELEADTLGKAPPVLRELKAEHRTHNRALRLLARHPTKSLVALAFMGTGEFMIADFDGNPMSEVVRPVEWKVNDKEPRSAPRMVTYVNVAVTESAVYALFAGKPLEEALVDGAVDARQVHVHDWAGNLLGIIEMDRSAMDIAVNDGILYTLNLALIPEIRRYALPE